MSEVDYAELFKSPLDDEPDGGDRQWLPAAAGLILGLLVVGALSLTSNSEEITTVATTTGPPATTLAASGETQQYPPGFTEIAPGLGAEPIELIRQDDSLLVAFHTAGERNSNQTDLGWPIGGAWWLENADGSGVESRRVVLGRFSPGVFAVEFPRSGSGGGGGASSIRMMERWDLETEVGSERVPFSGEPYEMPESLVIPVSNQATLVVDELQLGSFIGRAAWSLDGANNPIGRVDIEVTLLDDTGGEVGTYAAFPVILDAAGTGVIEVFWQEPFPEDQEGAVTAVVSYSVGIVDVVATAVAFDLQGVPEGR